MKRLLLILAPIALLSCDCPQAEFERQVNSGYELLMRNRNSIWSSPNSVKDSIREYASRASVVRLPGCCYSAVIEYKAKLLQIISQELVIDAEIWRHAAAHDWIPNEQLAEQDEELMFQIRYLDKVIRDIND